MDTLLGFRVWRWNTTGIQSLYRPYIWGVENRAENPRHGIHAFGIPSESIAQSFAEALPHLLFGFVAVRGDTLIYPGGFSGEEACVLGFYAPPPTPRNRRRISEIKDLALSWGLPILRTEQVRAAGDHIDDDDAIRIAMASQLYA